MNATFQRIGVTQSGTAFDHAAGSTPKNLTLDWSYDSLGQVVAEDHSDDSRDNAYEFDTIGNRRRAVHGSLTLPTVANYSANRLNQLTTTPFPTAPSYDDDGNMTSGTVPGGYNVAYDSNEAFEDAKWDANNRLREATIGGGVVTFDYDYRGRRISGTGGDPSTQRYVYDGWNLVALKTGDSATGGAICVYTWGLDLSGSLQGAGGVGGLLVTRHLSRQCYPLYDGNGNATQYISRIDESSSATDSSAVQYVGRWEYDAFGRTTWQSDDTWSNALLHRFSTKEKCWRSGLYYYGYRYYDPVTGRWPSRYPIEERGGVNIYGMVGNDAVGIWDYLGLDWTISRKGGIFAVACSDSEDDSWEDLASVVGLESSEAQAWVKNHEENIVKGIGYLIPNTIYVFQAEAGSPGEYVPTNIFSMLENKVENFIRMAKQEGYNVEDESTLTRERFIAGWQHHGLAGVIYTGHGLDGTLTIADDLVVYPRDVSPPYKLWFVGIYACCSANATDPIERPNHINRWKNHVSSNGRFAGSPHCVTGLDLINGEFGHFFPIENGDPKWPETD